MGKRKKETRGDSRSLTVFTTGAYVRSGSGYLDLLDQSSSSVRMDPLRDREVNRDPESLDELGFLKVQSVLRVLFNKSLT